MLSEYKFCFISEAHNKHENHISNMCVSKDVRRKLRIQIAEDLPRAAFVSFGVGLDVRGDGSTRLYSQSSRVPLIGRSVSESLVADQSSTD